MEFQGQRGKASVTDVGVDGGGIIRDNNDGDSSNVLHKKLVVKPVDCLILLYSRNVFKFIELRNMSSEAIQSR